MLKNILNLKGAQKLNKNEQKNIHGGTLRPGLTSKCCDPAKRCCTTTHLALNQPSCGGTYISGCQYHPSTGCCI